MVKVKDPLNGRDGIEMPFVEPLRLLTMRHECLQTEFVYYPVTIIPFPKRFRLLEEVQFGKVEIVEIH